MLTDTDIHYIVGLLYQVSNPEDVDIILGDMVYNEASETKRDVDITITYKDANGSINAFLGVEVKDHKKPLDSIHVEQLCAKLKTHPEITKGYIVSSNGYTGPARKIAEYNKIELCTLKAWDESLYQFKHAGFSKDIVIDELSVNWLKTDNAILNFDRDLLELDIPYYNNSCFVFDNEKKPIKDIQSLSQLIDNLISNSLNIANGDGRFNSIPLNEKTSITLDVEISDTPFVLINQSYYQTNFVKVIGEIIRTSNKPKGEFKVLVKEVDNEPLVGCLISEMTNGNLIGITISSYDNTIRVVNIPIVDRLKKKIFKRSLVHSPIVKHI